MDYEKLNLALHLIIVLLLVWIIFFRSESLKTVQGDRIGDSLRGYVGGGLNSRIYTSGATMRRLAQEFSSSNQGQYMTVHNLEDPSAGDLHLVAMPSEKMTAAQGDVLANADLAGYVGRGINNRAFTSGATMRRLAQEFSSTNQAQRVTVHNIEKPEDPPIDVMVVNAEGLHNPAKWV